MAHGDILIVDDDREIVRLLRGYFEKAGYGVSAAYDGEGALAALRERKPDALILDLMLPDRDGWELTRLIRASDRLAGLPIIMLTARVEDMDKILGLELGADDYITKPFNPREVIARVRAVLRRVTPGGQSATRQTLQVGGLKIDPGMRAVQVEGRLVDLTPTEFDLLRALAEHPGYVFTRSELIEVALGYEYEGLERTLDSHVKNLRQKIEPDPRNPTYIQTVYGVGYRLAPPDAAEVG